MVRPRVAAHRFATASAAIGAAEQANRASKARILSHSIFGEPCTGSDRDAKCFRLLFPSGHLGVCVAADAAKVRLHVGDNFSHKERRREDCVHYVKRNASEELAWDRDAVLARCIGKELTDVVDNGSDLYLYWRDVSQCLVCSVADDLTDGSTLLYYRWAE